MMNKLKYKNQNESLTLILPGLAVVYFVNDADATFVFAGISPFAYSLQSAF